MLPIETETIMTKEINDDKESFFKKLIKYGENWHNGETFIYQNEDEVIEDKDDRYSQFKTIIEKENNTYFIYDEIIQINNKPVLLLEIHDEAKKEIWCQLIYLDKNEVVQQIRHLGYVQFLQEVKEGKKIISLEETADRTIIRTSFLDFIYNCEQQAANTEQLENSTKTKAKKVFWKVLKITIFVVAWAGIGLLGTLVFTPVLGPVLGTVATSAVSSLISGVIVGGIVTIWEASKDKIKKWFFPKWKSKIEKELAKQLEEQRIMLEKKYQSELFLSSTADGKQERMLNKFQELWQQNKSKTFENMQSELSQKFNENKKVVANENFAKNYQAKIEHWDQTWKAKVEFSESLKARHISEIKKMFKETETNKAIMCDGFYYQPKEVLAEFESEKILESMEELFENSKKYDNLNVEDIREKSPVRTMRKLSCNQ